MDFQEHMFKIKLIVAHLFLDYMYYLLLFFVSTDDKLLNYNRTFLCL